MKKLLSLVLMVVIALSLSACHSDEIETEKLRVNRENIELESIDKTYNQSINEVKEFNSILKEYISNIDDEEFVLDVEDYSNQTRNLQETIDSIVYNLREKSYHTDDIKFEIYPFMRGETGEIIDMVYFEVEDYDTKLYIIWSNGKFDEFYYE